MKRAKTTQQKQKYFFIKSYQELWELEEAIQEIRGCTTGQLQLSVLGKFAEDCISKDKATIKAKKGLKSYWKGSLGQATDFGLFCNPEMGTLFIAGSLASQFLKDMDGKVLGEMPSGPYGILRGLGIEENQATKYLNVLKDGHLLLILRGDETELESLRVQLTKMG